MSKDDNNKLSVVIRRQDGPDANARWERFEVVRRRAMTVADVLDVIEREPRTIDGQRVAPVVWESSCDWPVCGSCTMLINGQARLACGTTVDDVAPMRKKLKLEPLSSFALRRDLWVDRSRMRRGVSRLRAWVEAGDRPADAAWERFSRCTDCGACIDACPEAHRGSAFVGPAAINAAHLAALHEPSADRAEALIQTGGIASCGHALNCMQVCPEQVPLDEVMASATGSATKRWLNTLFGRRKG